MLVTCWAAARPTRHTITRAVYGQTASRQPVACSYLQHMDCSLLHVADAEQLPACFHSVSQLSPRPDMTLYLPF